MEISGCVQWNISLGGTGLSAFRLGALLGFSLWVSLFGIPVGEVGACIFEVVCVFNNTLRGVARKRANSKKPVRV